MNLHFCGRRDVLEGAEQPLEREDLNPNELKFPLLHGHIMDVSKLLLPARGVGERPYTPDWAIA